MTTNRRDDAAILAWLEEGPTRLTATERSAIADAAELVAQRRSIVHRLFPDTRRLVVFASAILAAAITTSVLLVALAGEQNQPSPSSSPGPTSSAAVSPSPGRPVAACGSSIIEPAWTGRVRSDVAGMPACTPSNLSDPRDAADAGIDIIAVVGENQGGQDYFRIHLDGYPQAARTLDPDQTVIEYGFVFDTTGDGIPDWEVGINNDAPEPGQFRTWVTDLAAGSTEEQVGGPYGFPVEFAHPDEMAGEDPPHPPEMLFTFLGSSPWEPTGAPVLFYAWSSITSGGDVADFDYAPDFGWLGAGEGPTTGGGDQFELPYPAPLRVEPPGGFPILEPTRIEPATPDSPRRWSWSDAGGEPDVASEDLVDLLSLELSRGCIVSKTVCVDFTTREPFGEAPPSSYSEWIAYGLDVDSDGDGEVDLRFGMDNMAGGHRSWFQNLQNARIDEAWSLGTSANVNGGTLTAFPWTPQEGDPNAGRLWLGQEVAVLEDDVARFYAWAALVRDGELVAIDVAPDDGWLELRPWR